MKLYDVTGEKKYADKGNVILLWILGGIQVTNFNTIEEAIEIANQSSFGLCGCIISKDQKVCQKVANELECGGVIINGASFFRSFEMPFGGWKHSGYGNEGVASTLHEMSRTKTVILKNIL